MYVVVYFHYPKIRVALAAANATLNINSLHLYAKRFSLIESFNLPVHQVDVECCRLLRETRHTHDVA